MKDIAIFGAGGLGKEVAMLIEQINTHEMQWNILGFYDDGLAKGRIRNGYKVLGGISDLNAINSKLAVVIAIGDPESRASIYSSISNPYTYFPVLIHPSVITGNKDHVCASEGTIITAGNLLTVNIKLGKFVLLNLGCTIGHDTTIADFASIMPGVNVSGEVTINEKVFIGSGAQILNRLEIGSNTKVGAGAVVIISLPANCTAVGVPAKIIKNH